MYGAVEQRYIERIPQGAVLDRTDAVHKQVGIKARRGNQRENPTGQWVYGHYGAAAVTQGLNSRPLNADIQVQDQV